MWVRYVGVCAFRICADSVPDLIRFVVDKGGTWWRSWLRNCATIRKVEYSIPGCVIIFLNALWPSG